MINYIKTIWSFVYGAFQKFNKYELPPSFANSDSVTDRSSEAHNISIFASYIKKVERRNSNQALTNAANFGKQKGAGKKNS